MAQGTTITFNANFYDIANNLVNPANATLTVYYHANDVPANSIISMAYSNTANCWTCDWASNVADPGVVNWRVVAIANNWIVETGSFRLTTYGILPH